MSVSSANTSFTSKLVKSFEFPNYYPRQLLSGEVSRRERYMKFRKKARLILLCFEFESPPRSEKTPTHIENSSR